MEARLLVGVVLIAHGRQKLFEDGSPEGTAAGFSAMGVPAPACSAWTGRSPAPVIAAAERTRRARAAAAPAP